MKVDRRQFLQSAVAAAVAAAIPVAAYQFNRIRPSVNSLITPDQMAKDMLDLLLTNVAAPNVGDAAGLPPSVRDG